MYIIYICTHIHYYLYSHICRYSDQLVDLIIKALNTQTSSVVAFESITLLAFLLETVGASVTEKSIDFYPEVGN